MFGDYKPLPSPWRQGVPVFDRSAYGRMLIDEPHRSDSSRYAQLIDDVRDDITRFEPFFSTAIKVFDLDRKRNASLAHVSELSPRERADAIARMEENTMIVQWVQQCLERRISSYHWALERLVIQAPDNMAAEADRLINELAAQTANPPVAVAARDRPRRERAGVGSFSAYPRKQISSNPRPLISIADLSEYWSLSSGSHSRDPVADDDGWT